MGNFLVHYPSLALLQTFVDLFQATFEGRSAVGVKVDVLNVKDLTIQVSRVSRCINQLITQSTKSIQVR